MAAKTFEDWICARVFKNQKKSLFGFLIFFYAVLGAYFTWLITRGRR
jgi:hypothetical protein